MTGNDRRLVTRIAPLLDHRHEGDSLRAHRLACLPCPPDRGDLSACQIGRQRWKPIDLIVGPTVFNPHVLALDIASILEALAKASDLPGRPHAIVVVLTNSVYDLAIKSGKPHVGRAFHR